MREGPDPGDRGRTHARRLVAALLLLAGAGPAAAQLSPGQLSRFHEVLEGMRKCESCHALGDREVRAQCLGCHGEIVAMRRSGEGLHGRPEYADCVDCHVEHQGRSYELVRWPGGRDRFDHTLTGFALTGAHAGKECRACHAAKFVADPDRWKEAGKDLDRTFLGLDPACASCHPDPHDRQFRKRCSECHVSSAWKPASFFDHAATAYPLTGRHARAACASCHPPAEAPRVTLYAGLAHAGCADCHRDPHRGALGAACAACHATEGWGRIRDGAFDHDKTRYPLRGRHAAVPCAGCHESRGAKPAFARCADCHRDEHGGTVRGRPGWIACEACHDVEGFRPSRFTVADHDTTDFPLRGSHLATPCGACHATSEGGKDGGEAPIADLAPAAASCASCHEDVHRWAAASPPACAACHAEESWHAVSFDHAGTRFPLTGRHGTTRCAACHHPADDAPPARLAFGGEPTACAGCHPDVHQGTMTPTARETGSVDCSRCHVTVDWLAEKFDHDRDSRFPLRGAHAKVACRECHQPPAGERTVRFRPLAVECVACHVVPSGGGKEDR